MNTGFKDEKHLWKWMRPRMLGRWSRYEPLLGAGIPDALGTYSELAGNLQFLELKVGHPTIDALEPSQIEFLKWMEDAQVDCYASFWIAFGSELAKDVKFCLWPDFGHFHKPEWWKG